MAYWWEVWSPGLQAISGSVELYGAILLALEWWRANKEAMENALRQLDDDFGPLDNHSTVEEQVLKRRRVYIRGFALIVTGVVGQIAANGIAWAGAYGLFDGRPPSLFVPL